VSDNSIVEHLSSYDWMPSRIPVRDALATIVGKGIELPKEKIPGSHEQRWYPLEDGSLKLLVPYENQPFDQAMFHIEERAWDHTTCDVCVVRIPPMTLCYVTKPPWLSRHTPPDPYVDLCTGCYEKYVVNRRGVVRRILWKAERLVGIDGPL
jgi:hypothetical protein